VSRPNRTLESLLRVLFALVCLTLAVAPLARSGFSGDDLALLGRASGHAISLDEASSESEPALLAGAVDMRTVERPDRPLPLFDVPPIDVMQLLGDDARGDTGSLLSGYSIGLSLRLWGSSTEHDGGLHSAFWYRFENFLWLVVAALGLWRFLWRIFRPWVGSEQATRASSAAAFLFVLHPLAIPSIAAVAGRADVMALAFGTWAAAAFLRGRQERRYGFVHASAALTLLSGLCGQVSLTLPFSLALAEAFSSYRYRPVMARVRTALVTLFVFSAVVQLNTAVVALLSGHGYYPVAVMTLSRLGDLDGALRALALSIEKVGVLLLPANMATLGLVGLFGAGLLGLVALQPALIAARTAPRLWGWTLACWLGAVAVSLLFGVHERVRLDGLATATTLLPAAAALCSGWGLAATALPGLRRLGVPIVLALGLAILAHGNALAWARATDAFAETVAQVRERGTASSLDPAGRLGGVTLLIDAPRSVAGMDPIGVGLEWVRHPLFDPEGPWPSPPRTIDVPSEALGAVVRAGLWTRWRERGLRVGVNGGTGRYAFTDVMPGIAAGTGSLAIDPAASRALVVEANEALPAETQVLWSGQRASGSAPLGPWLGDVGARTSWVDLAGRTDWLLTGTVDRVWFEPVVRAPVHRLEAELPRFVGNLGEPRALDDGRWTFGALAAGEREGDIELRLLDLASLETRVELLRPDASGALVVEPPSDLVYRAREYGVHEFAFELTRFVDGAPVARVHGVLPRAFLR
jgi:hypothetical protein